MAIRENCLYVRSQKTLFSAKMKICRSEREQKKVLKNEKKKKTMKNNITTPPK